MIEFYKENYDMFFSKQNVVGVGIGNKYKNGQNTGDNCITVFVSQKIDKSLLKKDDLIPERISTFKTDVIETGVIFAGGPLTQDSTNEIVVPQILTKRIRPAKGGYSVGHLNMSQGIKEVILKIQDQWMSINGVVGVGEGIINYISCILIFVDSITTEIKKNIPSIYKGFPIKIIKSGIIYGL